MQNYYVTSIAQANKYYEVHGAKCKYLPFPEHRVFLGTFDDCESAILNAKEKYPKVNINVCHYCVGQCYTK